MVLYLVSVFFKDGHVDEFVFLCWFKVEAVLFAKLLLEFRKRLVYQNFLQLANNLVESVVLLVVHPAVANLEVFILPKIISNQVLT